jgi:hypothetical protein
MGNVFFSKRGAAGLAAALTALAILPARGQQPAPPSTGDLPCSDESQFKAADTVVSQPDAQGYYSLFDGTFNGWFQSCLTLHSQADRSVGAIWRVGPGADGKPVIFSAQRYPKKVGGILMTKKKFGNYEIVFDFWPTYQDDGGIFNRTDIQGNCYQTLLDYINGSGLGGPYGEGNFTQFLHPPWKFNSDTDPKQMSIGADDWSWTTITRKLKANGSEPNLPCPATGCTKDDWLKLWDFNGWNQIKAQFYGGTGPGTGAVHMRSWMKKAGDAVWVPLSIDSTVMGNQTIKPGYIGLQVHWNTGWQDNHWNLYRNIKWRPLDDKGNPTSVPTAGRPPVPSPAIFSFTATARTLMGSIDQDYAITIRDAGGRIVEGFSGKAGDVRHDFASDASGVLFLGIRTVSGVRTASVVRAVR